MDGHMVTEAMTLTSHLPGADWHNVPAHPADAAGGAVAGHLHLVGLHQPAVMLHLELA